MMVSLQSCSELILQKYEYCSREFSGNAVKFKYFTWDYWNCFYALTIGLYKQVNI